MGAHHFPHRPAAVFFVGDSITLGWRDENLGGWPARLIGALPTASPGNSTTMYNLGVRGDTSDDIAKRWHDEVRRRRRVQGTAVVFAFGINDAKMNANGVLALGEGRTRANVADILATATLDHRVLFIGPTPVEEVALHQHLNAAGDQAMPSNSSIGEISAIISEQAALAGVPFLDLFEALSGDARWLATLRQTDGLHPPADGHDIIAGAVGAWQPWTTLFAERRS